MATCVSNESNPFTTATSFTLKPRVEKCSGDRNGQSAPFAPLLAPSFGRGLRIRSSFDEEESQTRARSLTEPLLSVPSVTVEPPSWAVRANGEARLEPVGATKSTHGPIDLSSSACFRIGRSPSSDVRLIHPTSSRRHALIFHHPNGSCYVVDCGSAHGTYVNGVRVGGPVVQEGNGERATAIPYRIRRGAMVRFGGPGAPTFVLKSFSASFENLVRELCGENGEQSKGACSPTTAGKPSPSLTLTTPRRSPLLTKDDGPQASGPCSPKSALVALNTRVNALGGGALLSQRNRMIARQAAPKFVIGSEVLDQIDSCLLGKRSRSEDNMMSYSSDDDCGGFSCDCSVRQPKRSRSATYPLSPDPIRGCLKQDMTSNLMQTPLIYERLLTTMEVEFFGKNDARRKVKFAEETQNFYPASVTPDEGSFDEEHMKQ